jgi:hypothetical protein
MTSSFAAAHHRHDFARCLDRRRPTLKFARRAATVTIFVNQKRNRARRGARHVHDRGRARFTSRRPRRMTRRQHLRGGHRPEPFLGCARAGPAPACSSSRSRSTHRAGPRGPPTLMPIPSDAVAGLGEDPPPSARRPARRRVLIAASGPIASTAWAATSVSPASVRPTGRVERRRASVRNRSRFARACLASLWCYERDGAVRGARCSILGSPSRRPVVPATVRTAERRKSTSGVSRMGSTVGLMQPPARRASPIVADQVRRAAGLRRL